MLLLSTNYLSKQSHYHGETVIDKEGNFPVQGRSVKSTLYSVPDCQAITKKAIVERLKHAHQEKGWLSETGAKISCRSSNIKR